MLINELGKYKKVLITGQGIESRSVENFLRQKFPDIQAEQVFLEEGKDTGAFQSKYDLVVKTPGVNKREISISYTTPTNIFFANAKSPIIGITGTKGKSTTTSLIYAILKEAGYDARLCGNIGRPMLDQLLEPVIPKTLYVAELSSYQLDDIKYSPHISVILNIFPEHMTYHGSFEAYKMAKMNIVKFSTSNDYFVFNDEYPELAELAKLSKAKPIPISAKLPFDESIIPLLGEHNVFNVRAAYTVAKIMGVADEDIKNSVSKFTPLSHRLEQVGTFRKIAFYDDAISTTPESTIQALNSIPTVKTLFLGGEDRGYDFTELAKKIAEKKVENIVLFPDSGNKIKEELLKTGSSFNFLETRNMEDAVQWAYKVTPAGSVCLLSCASPSYSIWKNFEEKGDLFKQFVKELGQE